MTMRALQIAATGMQAQQTNVEVIANNLANVSTNGYKRQLAQFQDLIYQSTAEVGSTSSEDGSVLPTGTQVGLGVRAAGITRMTAQGSLTQTDNTYDLAINGPGYFGVKLPSGDIAYTRDGSFSLSPTGQIVNSQGYPIEPGISIPPNATSVTINQAGGVNVTNANGKQTVAGTLQLNIFQNEAGLEAQGGDLFTATAASGQPVQGLPTSPGYGNIQQGYLESSNVNVVTELTDLIQAQRAYEMNSKVIEAADQMMQTANQVK